MEYRRCPASALSYDYYCYTIFASAVDQPSVSAMCDQYNGRVVWFQDEAEVNWLQAVLQDFSIDCIHIGISLYIVSLTDD